MLRSFSSRSGVGSRFLSYSSSNERLVSHLGRKRTLIPLEQRICNGELPTRIRTLTEASVKDPSFERSSCVPHPSWHPYLPNSNIRLYVQSASLPVLPMASIRVLQSRWMSSSSGGGGNSAGTKKQDDGSSSSSFAAKKSEQPAPEKPLPESSSSSSSSTSIPIAAQLESRIKKVVNDLALSDMLAVGGIVLLLVLIVSAPYVVGQMKKSDSTYEEITGDDPVDNLTTMIRRGWAGGGSDNGEDGEGKNPVEYMLRDVLQSKALQQAAQKFVIQIMESDDFKAGLNRLIKELWKDLVEDPETIAQVVKLLQIAIQDPAILKAVQKLVLDLVEEPDVKQALIEMIQKLGNDAQVQAATQTLLSESAHNALNDPEILDHSMEFATDVVGDDIVQRTAGEALRNTVGHAVRPASSIFLTATGVGLIIFGVVAIGYARSSDQEARLFEVAARSLHTNATSGIVRILTWPGRVIRSGVLSCGYYLAYPFVVLQTALVRVRGACSSGIQRASASIVQGIAKLVVATGKAMAGRLERSKRYVSDSVVNSLQAVAKSLSESFVGGGARGLAYAYSVAIAAVTTFLFGVQDACSQGFLTSQRAGKTSIDSLSKAGNAFLDAVLRLGAALHGLWFNFTV
jgi:hypothetical protein